MAKKHTSRDPHGGTPATVALERAGFTFTLHSYDHDPQNSAYGDEAAAALGVDPARIFKTLIVQADGLTVAVLPVADHLDLKAMGGAVGTKRVTLADPALARRSTGYVLGGISPLGQRTPLPTVLDESALAFATILLSAGKRGLQVELSPQDLVAATGAIIAAIGTVDRRPPWIGAHRG